MEAPAGEVRAWLNGFGRGDLAAAFVDDGYDTLEAVSHCTWEDDLMGLKGMKKGYKKVLEAHIEELKAQPRGGVSLTPQPPQGTAVRPRSGGRGGRVADAAASPSSSPSVTVTVREDGTRVQTDTQSGVIIEIRPDGTKLQQMPNGTSIEVRVDGTKIQQTADGTRIEISTDGTKRQTNPTDGSTIEQRPDGTKISTLACGTKITTKPNGYRLQTNPDGSTHETKPDKTVVQVMGDVMLEISPTGEKTQTNTSTGVKIKTFVDGKVMQSFKDGVHIITNTDGSSVQRNPDGTTIVTSADEVTTQTGKDGSRLVLFPDGRQAVRDAKGACFEILPNGQQTLPTQASDASPGCTECTQCSTIISLPNNKDTIAFSCPVCSWVIVSHRAIVIGMGVRGVEGPATPADRETEVRTVFASYDRDDSGTIDKGELDLILSDLHFPASSVDDLFDRADGNADGVLSWDEFVVWYNLLQDKLLASAVVADIRLSDKMLAAARSAIDEDHTAADAAATAAETVGAGEGGGQVESVAARAQRLRARADALKQMSADLVSSQDRLQTTLEAEKEASRRALEERLAKRKEKMQRAETV